MRSRWLDAATAALAADQAVAGAALVGSLGDGRADDWSDVDLLLVVEDTALDGFAVPGRLPRGPGRMSFAVDARHNGPRGTRAVSAQYVVDGLPLWVDWHVHPVALAAWPSDATVLFDRVGVPAAGAGFADYLARGGHEAATPKSAEDGAAMRLALVPVAGKLVARRSPDAAGLIEFLGGPDASEASWRSQVAALHGLLDGFAGLGRPDSLAAGRAHLELLERILGGPALLLEGLRERGGLVAVADGLVADDDDERRARGDHDADADGRAGCDRDDRGGEREHGADEQQEMERVEFEQQQ
jgi:hypothetical protein